jgi:hypothetical protein
MMHAALFRYAANLSRTAAASGANLLLLFLRLVANGLVRYFDLFPVFVQSMDVGHESGVFRAVRLSFCRACGRESILFVRQMNPVTHGL